MEFQLKIFIIHYKFYFFQEEDLSKLVECMALNSNLTSSESESEVSEVSQNILEDDSLLVTISIKQTGTISSKTYKLRISSCRVFRKEGQKVLKVFFSRLTPFWSTRQVKRPVWLDPRLNPSFCWAPWGEVYFVVPVNNVTFVMFLITVNLSLYYYYYLQVWGSSHLTRDRGGHSDLLYCWPGTGGPGDSGQTWGSAGGRWYLQVTVNYSKYLIFTVKVWN